MNRIIRTLLIVCGTLCVGLAVVGIFVPILPTTPFLLLAAVCYARSSQRFLAWLLTNRWFGSYIKNYREGRGIPVSREGPYHCNAVAHDRVFCTLRCIAMVGESRASPYRCWRHYSSPSDQDVQARP